MSEEAVTEQKEIVKNAINFDSFCKLLIQPEYDEFKPRDWSNSFDVHENTIRNWMVKVDWEWVKRERRKAYAPQILRVDRALFKAAEKLDVAAMKLAYERFDGWIPKSEQINSQKSDEDLKKRAKEITQELIKQASEIPNAK